MGSRQELPCRSERAECAIDAPAVELEVGGGLKSLMSTTPPCMHACMHTPRDAPPLSLLLCWGTDCACRIVRTMQHAHVPCAVNANCKHHLNPARFLLARTRPFLCRLQLSR